MRRRGGWIPVIEVGVALLLVATIAVSYALISRRDDPRLLTPPLVATLLVANLVPAMALMVLLARRLALKRASQTALGMKSRLPVRLVAIFSVIASVPTSGRHHRRLLALPVRRGILVLGPRARNAGERDRACPDPTIIASSSGSGRRRDDERRHFALSSQVRFDNPVFVEALRLAGL